MVTLSKNIIFATLLFAPALAAPLPLPSVARNLEVRGTRDRVIEHYTRSLLAIENQMRHLETRSSENITLVDCNKAAEMLLEKYREYRKLGEFDLDTDTDIKIFRKNVQELRKMYEDVLVKVQGAQISDRDFGQNQHLSTAKYKMDKLEKIDKEREAMEKRKGQKTV